MPGTDFGYVAISPPTAAAVKSSEAAPKTPDKRKLDAKQKQAIDILQSVESEIGQFSPEMQAYLLQDMARAYKKVDRAKQIALLKEAFQSAANMQDTETRTEQQNAIVRELDEADPSALLSMQYSPDPKVRATVLRLLVKQDIDHGRLKAAVQRLSQWDTSVEYPYSEAKSVITKLGPQQSGERQSVFSSAMAAYRVADTPISPDDGMADLILGTYELIPPAMVIDAVDLVLNKTAKANKADDHLSLSVGGKGGQATFDNFYDFELFKLLPVLDKVDPAKAESLRRDHANIAALTKKYPNGLSSLNPGTSGMSIMMSSGNDPSPMPPGSEMNQQLREAETMTAIVSSADKGYDAAIAAAQNLSNTPNWEYAVMTPRCRVLDRLATEAVNSKNFTAANAALRALTSAIQDLPPLMQAHYLVHSAALRAEMNDPQSAKQDLGKAMKAAESLYQKDAFGDPANEAPEAIWPSTAVWKALLVVASRIDAGFALQQSASLPDPAIEAAGNAAIAAALLGEDPSFISMEIWRNGQPYLQLSFDVPWWQGAKGQDSREKAAGGQQ